MGNPLCENHCAKSTVQHLPCKNPPHKIRQSTERPPYFADTGYLSSTKEIVVVRRQIRNTPNNPSTIVSQPSQNRLGSSPNRAPSFGFFGSLLFVLLLSGCDSEISGAESEVSANPRPNVLILFTDDQRFNTVHSLGNEEIRTPNMDRLVREGTAFTHAQTMGGMHGALCAPSRAMLMTGRSLFNLQESGDVIPESHVMMPTQFASAGYKTFGTGKWHNNKQAFNRGFQSGKNIYFGGMHWPQDGGHEGPWLHDYDESAMYPDSTREQRGPFSSTLFADAAIEFIRSRNEADSPFFAYVAFSSPHDPRTPPEPYASWYQADSVSLPSNFAPQHPFDNGELAVRDELLLPHPRTPEAVRKEIALYYGMVSEVDAQIGRILDVLDETGVREKTIVVFAGDNGLAVGSHGLLGKQNLYDHSMRVPLVIAGPGVPKNERRDALVYLLDLFPTIAGLADVKIPSTVDGRNLSSAIQNSEAPVRDAVFYAYKNIQRGVRTSDNWKLIAYDVNGESHRQLFDLASDPDELTNLADDTTFGRELARMDSLLIRESRANNDRLDLSETDWGKTPAEEPVTKSHLAVGKGIELTGSLSDKYPGSGPEGLIDGTLCTSDFNKSCWHALEGGDLDAIVDLGDPQLVTNVTGRFMRNLGAWIFLPGSVEVSISSDKETWTEIGSEQLEPPSELDGKEIRSISISHEPVRGRYVRIRASSQGVCPDWHSGAGKQAWLFVDELVVE